MSLINEALRKARHEAARQDAAKRGLSYPAGEAPPRRLPIVPLVAAAAVILAAGGLYFRLGGRSTEESTATTPSEPAVAAAETPPSDGGAPTEADTPGDSSPSQRGGLVGRERPVSGESPPGESVNRPPTAAPERLASRRTAASTPRAAVTAPEPDPPAPSGRAEGSSPQPAAAEPAPPRSDPPSTPRTAPETAPAPAATVPVPPIRAEPASGAGEPAAPPGAAEPTETIAPAPLETAPAETAPAEALTFVGEAAIPGAGTLRLGGIAWSERQPYALINSRVVGPGDRIEGLQITAVGRAEVRLRGDDGATYVLRLR